MWETRRELKKTTADDNHTPANEADSVMTWKTIFCLARNTKYESDYQIQLINILINSDSRKSCLTKEMMQVGKEKLKSVYFRYSVSPSVERKKNAAV